MSVYHISKQKQNEMLATMLDSCVMKHSIQLQHQYARAVSTAGTRWHTTATVNIPCHQPLQKSTGQMAQTPKTETLQSSSCISKALWAPDGLAGCFTHTW